MPWLLRNLLWGDKRPAVDGVALPFCKKLNVLHESDMTTGAAKCDQKMPKSSESPSTSSRSTSCGHPKGSFKAPQTSLSPTSSGSIMHFYIASLPFLADFKLAVEFPPKCQRPNVSTYRPIRNRGSRWRQCVGTGDNGLL